MNEVQVLIVGGGHAGAQCAIALRQNGFDGSITVVGREAELPYERPPLSKEYFAREKAFERLYIRPPAFWEDKEVHFELGLEVTHVDPEQRCAKLSDGRQLTYGKLVWAAGGDPRRLTCPGSDLDGIHTVRTREDCDRLMAAIDAGASNFVVIGGGYIGLEAAAVLVKLGRKVTLLEALPRVLARVAGEQLSHFYEAEHRLHGVDLRTGAILDAFEGDGVNVTGVRLGDGTVIPADAVIVGIGISPSIEPLKIAGAKCSNGVDIDEFCRTSLDDVYAIGDCAAFTCSYAGGSVVRVESVQNANDMATCVAKALCGHPEPYHAFPWFWSNQFDLRLQTAGISTGFDQTVLRGSPENRSFAVAYLRGGKLIAIDSVNAARDFVQGRKLIEAGVSPDLALLADPAIGLKDLA